LQRRIELSSEEASYVRLLRPTVGLAQNNRSLNRHFLAAGKRASALNWFIPNYENPLYAGVYTILRFASRLASFYSIPTRIVLYDQTEDEISHLRERLEFLFPALRGAVSCTALEGGVSIATFWKSAYVVAERTGEANYYFIQDYDESLMSYLKQLKILKETITIYYGELSAKEKSNVISLWKSGKIQIIVAINAFGMGVNKPDVQVVIHASLPISIGK